MSGASQPKAVDALRESRGRSFWRAPAIGFRAQLARGVAPVAVIAAFASITGARTPGRT